MVISVSMQRPIPDTPAQRGVEPRASTTVERTADPTAVRLGKRPVHPAATVEGDHRPRGDQIHLHAVFVAPRAVQQVEPEDAATRAASAMHHAAGVIAQRISQVPSAVDGQFWTDLSRESVDALVADIDVPANLTIHPQDDFDDLIAGIKSKEIRQLFESTLAHPLNANVGILADNYKFTVGVLYSARGLQPDANLDRPLDPLWKRAALGLTSKLREPGLNREPDEVNLVLDIDTTEETLKAPPLPESSPVKIPKRILSSGSCFDLVNDSMGFRTMVPGHPKNLAVIRLIHDGLTTGDYELPWMLSTQPNRAIQADARRQLGNAVGHIRPIIGTSDSETQHEATLHFFEAAERIRRNRPWFQERYAQAVTLGDEVRANAISYVFDAGWQLVSQMAMSLSRPHELVSDGNWGVWGAKKTLSSLSKLSKMLFNCPPPQVRGGSWIGEPLAPERWKRAEQRDAATMHQARALFNEFNEAFPGIAMPIDDSPDPTDHVEQPDDITESR